jgi:hypothetical protein
MSLPACVVHSQCKSREAPRHSSEGWKVPSTVLLIITSLALYRRSFFTNSVTLGEATSSHFEATLPAGCKSAGVAPCRLQQGCAFLLLAGSSWNGLKAAQRRDCHGNQGHRHQIDLANPDPPDNVLLQKIRLTALSCLPRTGRRS